MTTPAAAVVPVPGRGRGTGYWSSRGAPRSSVSAATPTGTPSPPSASARSWASSMRPSSPLPSRPCSAPSASPSVPSRGSGCRICSSWWRPSLRWGVSPTCGDASCCTSTASSSSPWPRCCADSHPTSQRSAASGRCRPSVQRCCRRTAWPSSCWWYPVARSDAPSGCRARPRRWVLPSARPSEVYCWPRVAGASSSSSTSPSVCSAPWRRSSWCPAVATSWLGSASTGWGSVSSFRPSSHLYPPSPSELSSVGARGSSSSCSSLRRC